MGIKYVSIIVLFVLLMAACAPAAASAPAPAVQTTKAVVEAAPTAALKPTDTTAPAAPTAESAVAEVSFSKDIWPVIEKFALSTHGGRGGVFLESYTDIMKYVVPGKPEESVLYHALTGTKGHPVMPPGNPFPSATIQLFYDWILQGAKNN